ncbi:DUF111 family protein [Kamptonema cortianum]|nr:nickel insertion protein [Oscillatoria laete-virens]MDK3160213.1 DUF111 family protein [Kamptonema cortianum]MDL5048434.1 DUF111 family protein [Oscillatoria amoena NRMC-F 0135]MDL5055655.1 DUF111 family protein [Oscillatoria laete-virens NRMC-F 0139]
METDNVILLETNVDDCAPEIIGAALVDAFGQGALDAWATPVMMKKNRPGTVVSLLAEPAQADALADWLMRQTGSFGVRMTEYRRRKLHREFSSVGTPYGSVRVKIGRDESSVVVISPEYESCRVVAAGAGVPVRVVYEAALKAAPAVS